MDFKTRFIFLFVKMNPARFLSFGTANKKKKNTDIHYLLALRLKQTILLRSRNRLLLLLLADRLLMCGECLMLLV